MRRRARRAWARSARRLVVMFASPALCEQAEELLAAVHDELAPEHLIGAMGEAIVGDGREIEDGPGPGRLGRPPAGRRGDPVPPGGAPARRGHGRARAGPTPCPTRRPADVGPVVMLAEPFTFPADGLLAELNGEDGPGGGRRARVRRAAARRAPPLRRHRRRGRGRRGRRAARRPDAHRRLAGLHADRPRDGDHRRRGLDRARAGRHAGAWRSCSRSSRSSSPTSGAWPSRGCSQAS